eukprot:1916892-Ditylum_brightwellii.AAC.1
MVPFGTQMVLDCYRCWKENRGSFSKCFKYWKTLVVSKYGTPESAKHFLEGNKGVSAKKLQNIFDVNTTSSPQIPPTTVEIGYQKLENP